jgi:GTP-binding protein
VGKSSLLNALASRRIAKTSGTPGKTRMLNVYELPLGRRERGEAPSGADRAPDPHRREPLPSPLSLYLLDLPGYGYSRASQTDRRAFRLLITHAMARPRLAGVLWLLDMRREPSTDDRAIQELFAEREARVLAALTKSDKLSRTERQRQESELREALGLDEDQVIVTSAREGEGILELREAIAGLIQRSPEDPGLAPGVSSPRGPV